MCNQAAKQYLSDYFDLDMSPHYAVMLTGAWGSGKTHFIKKVCREQKNRKIHYISLYGLGATSQIDDLIYAKLHPFRTNPVIKRLKRLATGLAAKIGFDLNEDDKNDADITIKPQIKSSSIMNADGNPKTIFVFDDFERCGIEAKVLLGYINYYVEHVGAKVVILSNPEKIEDENFQTLKEKVIGQSIEVQMDVDSALTEFIGLFAENPFGQVLLDNEILIKETFNSANYKNLRSLRTSFIALQRLYNALPQNAQDSKEYREEFLTLALPLSLEMSSGQDVKKLLDYYSSLMNGDEEKEKELAGIRSKYPKVRWAHISEPERLVLQHFFKRGLIDKPSLEQVALASHVFLEDKTPDWVRLRYVSYFDQATFDTAKDKVIVQLSRYEFKDLSQVLLIYGTLISLLEQGLFSEKTLDELVGEAKQYVEHVENNNLEDYAAFISNARNYGFFGSFDGFGVPHSKGRAQLTSWLENKQKAFIEKSQKMMATVLLQEIENIPTQGGNDLIAKFSLNGEYRNFAIFSLMNPSDVMDVLSKYEKPIQWDTFSYFVKSRIKFSNVDSYDPYLVELDFYKNLNCLLDTYILNHQGKVTILGASNLKTDLLNVIEKLKSRAEQKETMKVNVSAE